MTVAALVTGNCALLKPAVPSSVIAAKITEILLEARIPKGVFQYVPGKGSTVGEYLVQHPEVHLIAFTGVSSYILHYTKNDNHSLFLFVVSSSAFKN